MYLRPSDPCWWLQDFRPLQWNVPACIQPPIPVQPRAEANPLGKILLVGAALAGVGWILSELTDGSPQRACSVCGRTGHDRRNCPFDGARMSFAMTIPKSRRCQCCGQYGYSTQRHHTRGRADASDRLDVCSDCHRDCCHDGSFQNLASKPRICRVLDRPSFWRS